MHRNSEGGGLTVSVIRQYIKSRVLVQLPSDALRLCRRTKLLIIVAPPKSQILWEGKGPRTPRYLARTTIVKYLRLVRCFVHPFSTFKHLAPSVETIYTVNHY